MQTRQSPENSRPGPEEAAPNAAPRPGAAPRPAACRPRPGGTAVPPAHRRRGRCATALRCRRCRRARSAAAPCGRTRARRCAVRPAGCRSSRRRTPEAPRRGSGGECGRGGGGRTRRSRQERSGGQGGGRRDRGASHGAHMTLPRRLLWCGESARSFPAGTGPTPVRRCSARMTRWSMRLTAASFDEYVCRHRVSGADLPARERGARARRSLRAPDRNAGICYPWGDPTSASYRDPAKTAHPRKSPITEVPSWHGSFLSSQACSRSSGRSV